MNKIFKSLFTLRFTSDEIETDYKAMKDKNLYLNNMIYSSIFLVLAIIYVGVYNGTSFENFDKNLLDDIKIITHLVIGIHTLLLITSTIFKKSLILHRLITYFNIAALLVSDFTFRIFLIFFAKPDYLVFTLVFINQKFLTVTLFYTGCLDFFDGFLIYLTVSGVSYAIYAGIIDAKYHYFFAINFSILMTISLISYFYIYEKKKSFYFDHSKLVTIKWYKSILENINSGYISITNKTINWVNKPFLSLLEKIRASTEKSNVSSSNEGEKTITNEKSNLRCDDMNILMPNSILDLLFSDIKYDKLVSDEETKTDYKSAVEFIKNNLCHDNHREDFIFLGNKIFNFENYKNNEMESAKSFYEIYGRLCNPMATNKEENFEFIFNDITKTKLNEEINADAKYKTLFLSKIAHEFKNPLICIAELTEKIGELLNFNEINLNDSESEIIFKDYYYTKNKVKEILSQIKSMSEYLLILVKDLDFFSLKQPRSTNKIKLEKENVKLDRVINYCDNITNVLLKKYHKEDNIDFKVDCNEELYKTEIFTDEVRLKQLLINLLSNSVKYTYNGTISLAIKEEGDKILFEVTDTGIGISDEFLKRLKDNAPFNREITANSSGLGFSIIKDIIDLFGSKLEYGSALSKGSRFSFSIDKVQSNLRSETRSAINQSYASKSSAPSEVTIVESFHPILDEDLKLQFYHETNFKVKPNLAFNKKISDESNILKYEPDTDYYLVADDEKITRKSTIRILNNYFINNNPNERKKVILESDDGIQSLNYYYDTIMKGIKLSFIISDQTMNFLDGSKCANILNSISTCKGLEHVPFFIVSAYENLEFRKGDGVDKMFSKPITEKNIDEMTTFENSTG